MNIQEIVSSSRERIVTGFALLALGIALAVIDSYFVMWLIFGIVFMFSYYEMTRLVSVYDNYQYSVAALVWLGAAITSDILVVILAFIYVGYQVFFRERGGMLSFAPLIYPTVPFLMLISMYDAYGLKTIIWLVILVAFTDIGAYFVGRSIGKTTFSKHSPKKTLEGVYGGVAIATILGAIFNMGIFGFFAAIIVGFLVSIASVYGDLFESYLKRRAGVKDSGNLLPGHGGALDRMDGYLTAVVVLYIMLLGFAS
jgi:phosphatidate cytidylyltransferase